jgi:hypothetical protein
MKGLTLSDVVALMNTTSLGFQVSGATDRSTKPRVTIVTFAATLFRVVSRAPPKR